MEETDVKESMGSSPLDDREQMRAMMNEHLAGKDLPSLLQDLILCLDTVRIPGLQEEGILAEMRKTQEGRVVDIRVDGARAVAITLCCHAAHGR